MRPYYINKGKYGYYRIRLIDPDTGLITCDRSSHTKDIKTAESLAVKWMLHGVPSAAAGSTQKTRSAKNGQTEAPMSDMEQLLTLAKKLGMTVIPTDQQPFLPKPQAEQTQTPTANTKTRDAKLPLPYGIITSIPVCEFLLDFWNEETSEYVKKRRAKGKSPHSRHCLDMQQVVTRYWKPYFMDTKIGELDFNILDNFFFYIKTELGKANSTVNKAINVAAVAFEYNEKHGRLYNNPMKGIERYGDDRREVGILSRDEVDALFSAEWGKPVCRLANMLAATTGMRAGEISGLRYCDLGTDRIFINHAWGINDGLKSTKTNKKREVAVLPSMISALKELAEENPAFSQTSFVFWSPVKKGLEPYLPGYWEDDFYATLAKIGISKEMRQERNVVFHSWRHFYATQISQRAQEHLAQDTLGHSSAKMTAHYANHNTDEKMDALRLIIKDVTKNIVVIPQQLTA